MREARAEPDDCRRGVGDLSGSQTSAIPPPPCRGYPFSAATLVQIDHGESRNRSFALVAPWWGRRSSYPSQGGSPREYISNNNVYLSVLSLFFLPEGQGTGLPVGARHQPSKPVGRWGPTTTEDALGTFGGDNRGGKSIHLTLVPPHKASRCQ